jgi:hypothetical protein
MEFVDVLVTAGFAGIAFLTGFCLRGLVSEDKEAGLQPIDRPSGRYEPPRRGDRI